MAHKDRRCVKSPACDVAMAGGKKQKNLKHALLVAAFAKKQGLEFDAAADTVSKAVNVLLGTERPEGLEDFAKRAGVSNEVAMDLLDAFAAFGYIKVPNEE